MEVVLLCNEGNEPIYVHCRKGDVECKYWLDREDFGIEEAFLYNMSSRDTRQIRKIIYEHFEKKHGCQAYTVDNKATKKKGSSLPLTLAPNLRKQ